MASIFTKEDIEAIIPKNLELLSDGSFNINFGDLKLPKRPENSHKGNYGKLLIVGGSLGYTGAVCLCAQAAVRSGAGLCSVYVPDVIYPIIANKLTVQMPYPVPCDGEKISLLAHSKIQEKLENSDVCAIGCGLSRSKDLSQLVPELLRENQCQFLVDADGLFGLGNDIDNIKNAKVPPVLTPHEGEFARLGGVLTNDRVQSARDFAMSRNCVLVLKGHRCLCAFPDGEVYKINAGNASLAKGGSGDVLSGIIAGLLGQFPVREAVLLGTLIHAQTAELGRQKFSEYGFLATDSIDEIPNVMLKMER